MSQSVVPAPVPVVLPPIPVSVDDATFERLLNLTPAAPVAQQVELAWHLRQRDTARALTLADATAPLLDPQSHAARARLQLVRAEALLLAANTADCEAATQVAQVGFALIGDHAGASDSAAIRAEALRDAGRFADAREVMKDAHRWAIAAADVERVQCTQVVLSDWNLSDFATEAEDDWMTVLSDLRNSAEPRVLMCVHGFWGRLYARRGQLVEAISEYSAAYGYAIQIGQLRRAVVSCSNVAACCSNQGAHDVAMDWTEQGLLLARRAGWPSSIGVCLRLAGNSLYLQGHLSAARRALEEGLEIMQPLRVSREHFLLQFYLLYVLLDQGEAQTVLDRVSALLDYTRQGGLQDLEANCLVVQAKAMLALGRVGEARNCANLALHLAEGQGTPLRQIDAVLVLAEVHAPVTEPGGPKRSSLHYLTRALALGDSMKGYTPDVKTLEAAASEHAHLGNHLQALQLMQRAHAAHDAVVEHSVSMRTVSEAMRAGTLRRQAEATALRERIAVQMQRAQLLDEANSTLERLAEMGVAVTTHFGIEQIFENLYSHLQGLLNLQHLAIWLIDSTGRQLQLRYGLEQGQQLPSVVVSLESEVSNAARCVREARELLHETSLETMDRSLMPGTLRTLTALFGPLQVRQRIIGALSIQSEQAGVYGERERLVFRSVCAWAAIALDNSVVVEKLQSARQQLLRASEAERLARERAELATQLKSDVMTNMSHDLRTPLASLHGYVETLLLQSDRVSRDDQARYLDAALAQSAKVNRMARELMELSQLEAGFLQPRLAAFSLTDLLLDVTRKLHLTAHRHSKQLTLNLPSELPRAMADPAMIERVFTNLLDNAIQHTPPGTSVLVEASAVEEHLEVTVLDTGPGIPVAARDELFKRPATVAQPHRPRGGGLGLLIVHQLLQQHQCKIRLVHRPGFGAVFSFSLPRAKPD
jgi:signal transduction histidine kinase